MKRSKVGIAEAKRGLTQLIRQSQESNTEIVLTRRGKPVAVLVPFKEYDRVRRLRASQEIHRLQEVLKESGATAEEVYEASKQELEARAHDFLGR